MHYWSANHEQVLQDLNSNENGLTETEVSQRLQKYGKNILKKEKVKSPLKIFLLQFKSFLVLLLIAASIISYFIGNALDTLIILAIVVFNAIVGFVQEFKAEKAIEMLKKMTVLRTVVIRYRRKIEIDAENLVPGDIVVLEEGSKVPADCRIISQENLETDESSLTGESHPVSKNTEIYEDNTIIADRKNSLFAGTSVVRGRCKAVVVNTGMQTELGKIAKQIQVESPPTPLQQYLDDFGKKVIVATLIAVGVIFAINYFFEAKDLVDTFLTSVSLAVAAVPEGLPAIVTLTSAVGVKRMIARKTLIRRLSAIEALGSTTVIATDKTGTLTENKMTVLDVYSSEKISDIKECKDEMLFRIGLLCNNAELDSGDPTERALVISAKEFGLDIDEERKFYSRIKEIPFESAKKRMTVICKKEGKYFSFMKGAPDIIINFCDRIQIDGKIINITEENRKKIIEAVDKMASQALRVLGFAYKEGEKNPEQDLIFVGLQGIMDPDRPEVKYAIRKCKEAGIRVIMITGDHTLTAKAIAEKIEMNVNGVMTGKELNQMDDATFDQAVSKINIFARIEPSHKLKIVQKLREKGEIVAVTGDGVNDAPALKNSNIGVAMGIRGTDVAKEASDIIITDDNFATIVSAVEEGRRIFSNIRKFVDYLLTNNFGEVLLVLVASLLFLPLPVTAIQLLWINFLTDGFPALALGLDPAQKNIMIGKRKNRKIIDKKMVIGITQTGILMAIGLLYLFQSNLNDGLVKAQTIAFTGLALFQFIRLHVIESESKMKIWSNKYLLLAIVASVLLQLSVLYTPLSIYFNTIQLGLIDWQNILIVLFILGTLNYILSKITSRLTAE